jgi:hypothetical protein
VYKFNGFMHGRREMLQDEVEGGGGRSTHREEMYLSLSLLLNQEVDIFKRVSFFQFFFKNPTCFSHKRESPAITAEAALRRHAWTYIHIYTYIYAL